jgi:hypothetical protein
MNLAMDLDGREATTTSSSRDALTWLCASLDAELRFPFQKKKML